MDSHLGKPTIRSREKQLVKDLLDRYERQGKEGRPVVNTSDIIVVNFGLSLVQILDVDEMDQILKTNIWYQYVSNEYTFYSLNQHSSLLIILNSRHFQQLFYETDYLYYLLV